MNPRILKHSDTLAPSTSETIQPPNHSLYSHHHKRFCMICKKDQSLTGGSFLKNQGIPVSGLVRKFICATCLPGIPDKLKERLGTSDRPDRPKKRKVSSSSK